MSYKPKYCCQCGEKIERVNWKIWNSRRFCELCETEYLIYDWIPKLAGIGVLLIIFVISFRFQKTEKPSTFASSQLVSRISDNRNTANQTAAPQVLNSNTVHTSAQTANGAAVNYSPKTDLKAKQAENLRAAPPEKIYFCGAATKKGTPCSRRMKGGGRCWQHEGQTAMAAPEELLTNR